MNIIKTVLWDFTFLKKDNKLLMYSSLSAFSLLVTLITVANTPNYSYSSMSNLEILPYYIMLFIIISGIFFNKNKWSLHFFLSIFNASALSVFRIFILLVLLLIVSTFIKFFSVIFLDISPYYFNNFFSITSETLFYYPLIQLPSFFDHYRN